MIRRRVFAGGILVFALMAISSAGLSDAAAQEAARTVRLVIDYGDGVEKHFTTLPWREKMTVLDAMRAAQDHPRGVRLKFRGSGATAFLTQIDDVENEPGGRYWIYRVNDKLAERSFAVQTLQAGDAVLWKFEKSR